MHLTPEQQEIGRRNFLKAAAVLPPIAAFTLTAWNKGPVKTGIIGTGVEGRILISQTNPKYVHLIALADIRPDNQKLGEIFIGKAGHPGKPTIYADYKQLLANPEIEAVIIATPLHLHGPMALDALKAGKHVFTEKTMAMNLDLCTQMCQTAKQNSLNLQVGHQRFYNPLYWDTFRMFKEGLLGNVYHIRAGWHRNADWDYFKMAQRFTQQFYKEGWDALQKMDPKPYNYPDLLHLVNWRWFSETSRGMWTELCSHQTAITNWFFGDGVNDAVPKRVMATGGHYKVDVDFPPVSTRLWPGQNDPRDINDHVFAILDYGDKRTVTYSAIHSNSFDNYYEEIMGTYATVILRNENEKFLFWEPGWDEAKAKQAVEAQKKGTRVDLVGEKTAESASAFAAHVSGAPTGGGGASDMSELEPYKYELEGFAHTIRSGAPNLCPGIRAARAAQAAFAGQEAVNNGGIFEIKQPFTV